MPSDAAETRYLEAHLSMVGRTLETYLRFEHPDAMQSGGAWRQRLDIPLPQRGIGIDGVVRELTEVVIPNGSAVPRPGFSSFITTGGTNAAALAVTAASVASPQRYGLTAFNLIEEISLRWLATMCGIGSMQGVYSSGGSVANLLALGAARQSAFERVGRDPSRDGVDRPTVIYATAESHHTIQRSAGVLGLGRRAVRPVACDRDGRMEAGELVREIAVDQSAGLLPIAVVANAGTTNTGAIDPLQQLGTIARERGIWFHVDGAYGLPGILDERKALLYRGLELADSVIVDPHKWLGATVGVAATYVRDREILRRAFTQEPAAYLEGSVVQDAAASVGSAEAAQAVTFEHSLDSFGVPYYEYGVELSAPCRGIQMWAALREIGVEGMRERIVRHHDMAMRIAERARAHPNLELLCEPTLSICCFRYRSPGVADLDRLNQQLHRRLIHENRNMPSTTRVDGKLALRPCFVGARCEMEHADSLVDDVLRIGEELVVEMRRAIPVC